MDDLAKTSRLATGVPGLDDILSGGLPAERMYLVHGLPGVGKTTLALQFLLEGIRRGERTLYITLSETEHEIRQVALSHGWEIDKLPMYELTSAEQQLHRDENTLYSTEDVELRETVNVLLAEVERVRPTRIVFDSLSEIRLLAQSGSRYRRQILTLKKFFAGRHCTVLLLDDRSGERTDTQVESLTHGVISLEQTPKQYGADRRRVRVVKLRGSTFRSGHHDYVIKKGGITVYPRLIAAEHRSDTKSESMPSGVESLDRMLKGGIDRASSTLIIGPAGCGKSAIGAQFAAAAARRGEHVSVFLFEERSAMFRKRAQQLGLPLDAFVENKTLNIRQVDPAELAPDEFSHLVREEVEKNQTRLVVIDSINGYFTAMPEERFMALHIHELLAYLADNGVATIMTMAQAGVMGVMATPIDVSYLSDTVILLRYFEAGGHVRKALSILKKRSGPHEDSIRELTFGDGGIRLGEPLSKLRGVLTGVPVPHEDPRPAYDPSQKTQ